MSRLMWILMAVSLVACGKHEKPNFEYMPNMVYSPANKAQEPQDFLEGSRMREPVPGTVPREGEIYPFPDDPSRAAANLKNPLQKTREVLKRGKSVYMTYCVVCHGDLGEGDGYIVPKFSRPPTLHSDKVKNWRDGAIYHVITRGQNIMPGYQSQILPEDRWAVTHFIRVLQRAKNPSERDLERAKDW